MHTRKFIADRIAQRQFWAERQLELNCQQAELIAISREALKRFRKLLDDTRHLVPDRMNTDGPSTSHYRSWDCRAKPCSRAIRFEWQRWQKARRLNHFNLGSSRSRMEQR